MAHARSHTDPHQVAEHAAEWLDGKLFRVLGPPPLGPYGGEEAIPSAQASCPLCGKSMSQHTAEHEGAHTFLHCPDPGVTDVAESGRAA
ncbi:MAG TPA: hypothetical protein VIJ18_15435 [Microbacteriaceae bacterium]